MTKTALAVMFSAVVLCAQARAHPHVFVQAGAGFLVDPAGTLEGVRISWTYDALTSLFLFDALDLDKDGDGLLNDRDRAAIVRGETDWPPDYNGDVWLEVAGSEQPLGRPENAVASMASDEITVVFDLPLTGPAELAGRMAVLRLYDPAFYYAYTIGSEELSVLPQNCGTQVVPFEPDPALQAKLALLSRDETPVQENVGRRFADRVELVCP